MRPGPPAARVRTTTGRPVLQKVIPLRHPHGDRPHTEPLGPPEPAPPGDPMEAIAPAHGTATLLLIAAAAVAVLLFLIMKVRLHAFIALVLVSLLTALRHLDLEQVGQVEHLRELRAHGEMLHHHP